jgi:hypothetical protein
VPQQASPDLEKFLHYTTVLGSITYAMAEVSQAFPHDFQGFSAALVFGLFNETSRELGMLIGRKLSRTHSLTAGLLISAATMLATEPLAMRTAKASSPYFAPHAKSLGKYDPATILSDIHTPVRNKPHWHLPKHLF